MSGGSSSRYPPGNRFEEPFELKLSSPSPFTPADAPGANVGRLLGVIENVEKGVMVGLPQAPRGLKIILSGK